MQLIGMLDSPYVRRVAISLQLLGLRFEHRALSVFSTFDEFQRINPLVKAPTLICDDCTVLIDSGLILDYAETLAAPRSLMPSVLAQRTQSLRRIGLALAACEKSVQVVYEHELRPSEKLHQPWLDRVTGQLHAALQALQDEWEGLVPELSEANIDQAVVSTAVAWQFAVQMLPELIDPARYPALAELSDRAERLTPFRAAPHGLGTFGGSV
ncbi:glutathione S-transferase [Pseudomonas sp. GD04158]|uniref:glutathione S-transferase n=1 Tax=Pseudomonas sp. GD04158 TaxID=2975439 RepID=UPI002447DF4B|nr:glutathione S-transferase [Pseudomonas sp. GD04158]MDH0098614.1 glutathione S-transferase [Pseudomonas sp. GD04158]